jgi:hypothetical protein
MKKKWTMKPEHAVRLSLAKHAMARAEAELKEADRIAYQWTRKKPTEPGLYQMQYPGGGERIDTVEITREGRKLICRCDAYIRDPNMPLAKISGMEWRPL